MDPAIAKYVRSRMSTKLDPAIEMADARALARCWLGDSDEHLVCPLRPLDVPAVYLVPTTRVGQTTTIFWVVNETNTKVFWVEKERGIIMCTAIPRQAAAKRIGPWILTDPDTDFEHEFRDSWEWRSVTYRPTFPQALYRGPWHLWQYAFPHTIRALVKPNIITQVRNHYNTNRDKLTEASIRSKLNNEYGNCREYELLKEFFPRWAEETIELSHTDVMWTKLGDAITRRRATADTSHARVATAAMVDAEIYGAARPAITWEQVWPWLAVGSVGAFMAYQLYKQKPRRMEWTIGDLKDRWTRAGEFVHEPRGLLPRFTKAWRYVLDTPSRIRDRLVTFGHHIGDAIGLAPQPPPVEQITVWREDWFWPVMLVPIIEECIKRAALESGSLPLMILVGLLCADEGPANFLKHALTSCLPLPLAVLVHAANNYLAAVYGTTLFSRDIFDVISRAPRAMMWRIFPLGAAAAAELMSAYRSAVAAAPPSELPSIDTLASDISRLALGPIGPYPIAPVGVTVVNRPVTTVPRALAACTIKPENDFTEVMTPPPLVWPPVRPETPSINPIYMLVKYGGFPLTAPYKCEYNLYMVMVTRLKAKLILDTMPQFTAWVGMKRFIIPPQAPIPDTTEESFEEFVQHMDPAKRKLYRQVFVVIKSNLQLVHDRVRTVAIMIKLDEVLLRLIRVGVHFMYEYKPRAISNVHPYVSAYLGPHVYEASKRLKSLWDGYESQVIGGHSFHPVFASSFTDSDLTDVFNYALGTASSKEHFIFVAGDDSLVITEDQHGWLFLEGDFSQYDASQTLGPLVVEYCYLEELGMTADPLDVLHRSNSAPWKGIFPQTGTSWTINRPPMRNTGGVDTTIGNSTVNATLWLNALLTVGVTADPRLYEEYFLAKGFEIKLKVTRDPRQPTFLKGKWWIAYPPGDRNRITSVWAPLPSRILKLGKALQHPKKLYVTPTDIPKEDKDLYCATAFMHGAACNLRPFLQVPFISDFVSTWWRPTIRATLRAETDPHFEPYKIAGSGRFQDWVCDFAEHDISDRYGVSLEEVQDCRDLVRRALLGSCVSHPLLTLMAGVDYNGWTP